MFLSVCLGLVTYSSYGIFLQIQDMLEKISYPSYILDQKFLDDEYKQVRNKFVDSNVDFKNPH